MGKIQQRTHDQKRSESDRFAVFVSRLDPSCRSEACSSDEAAAEGFMESLLNLCAALPAGCSSACYPFSLCL